VYEIHTNDAFYRTDALERNSLQSALYVRGCAVRHRVHCTSGGAVYVRGCAVRQRCSVRQRVHCTSEGAVYVRGCIVRQRMQCTSEGALYVRGCSVRLRVRCTSEGSLYVGGCAVRQRARCTSDRPTSHFRQPSSPYCMALVLRTSKYRKWTRSQIVTTLRYRMDNMSGRSRVLCACHSEIEKPVLDICIIIIIFNCNWAFARWQWF